MTWSYTGDPSSSNKDAVRFIIGDTNTTDQLLSDEEINWLLGQYGSPSKTAYHACLAIAGKFARLVSQEAGRIKVKAESKYLQYKQLADDFRANEKAGFGKTLTAYAGGISKADIAARDANPDKPALPFSLGQDSWT